jgi:hypothetical protein
MKQPIGFDRIIGKYVQAGSRHFRIEAVETQGRTTVWVQPPTGWWFAVVINWGAKSALLRIRKDRGLETIDTLTLTFSDIRTELSFLRWLSTNVNRNLKGLGLEK